MKPRPLHLIFAAFLFWHTLAVANDVIVVTEDEFPVQYLEGGKLTGPAYKFVSALLEHADLSSQFLVLPWSRAYHMAQTEPNIVIFSMVRTSQREDKFHWIGELHPIEYHLLKLKKRTDLRVHSLTELGNLRVGMIRSSALYLYFQELGLSRNLVISTSGQHHFKLLQSEKVDLVPRNLASIKFDCIQYNVDCGQFESVMKLPQFNKGFFVALSISSDVKIKNALIQSYAALETNGTLARIMNKTYSLETLEILKRKLAN